MPAAAAGSEARCAQDYHAALTEIARTNVQPATEALVASRRALAGLPGRWLFGPYTRSARASPPSVPHEQTTETVERMVCIKPADEVGSSCPKEELRRTKRIVSLDPLAPPTPDRPRNVGRQEQALYYWADPLVKGAGQLRQILPDTPLGGVARRLATEMRGYVGQAEHPALCAGAPELMDLFDQQALILKRHVKSMLMAAQTGHELAALRMASVRTLVRQHRQSAAPSVTQVAATPLASTSGEIVATAAGSAILSMDTATIAPATNAAPAAAPQATSGVDERALPPLRALVAEAAALSLAPEDVPGVAALEQPLMAMQAIHASSQRAVGVQPANVRNALEDALGVLEAAAYAHQAAESYRRIDGGLVSGLDTIRRSHAKACTCKP